MEDEDYEGMCHGQKSSRRDSGLDVAFIAAVASKSTGRESGLEISHLDKFRNCEPSRLIDRYESSSDYPTSVSSIGSLEEPDCGSPIIKARKKRIDMNKLEEETMFEESSNSANIDDVAGLQPEDLESIQSENQHAVRTMKEVEMSSEENIRNCPKSFENVDLNLQHMHSPVENTKEKRQSENIDFDDMVEKALEILQSENSLDDCKHTSPKSGNEHKLEANDMKQLEKETQPSGKKENKGEADNKNGSKSRVLLRRKNVACNGKTTLSGKPPRPESCRPHSVSKVPISSRVEVMLSSDLFKKYLSKHENLIDKISMRQGRGTGLKKALSNLDLSQLDFDDHDFNENNVNLNASLSFNDDKIKGEWENSRLFRSRRNTVCETDYSTENTNDQDSADNVESQHSENICRLSLDSSLGKVRSSGRQKFSIPSFHEFKMSRQFMEIPEESAENEENESNCENCDKNRLENERRKSRSHSRCQRIKERYLQNHEDLTNSSTNTRIMAALKRRDNLINNDNQPADTCQQNEMLENSQREVIQIIPKLHPNEIPERILSTAEPVNSHKQLKDKQKAEGGDFPKCKTDKPQRPRILPKIPDSAGKSLPVRSVSGSEPSPPLKPVSNTRKISDSSLPPKHDSEPAKQRTISRASRKRKIGQKKPFVRSQSDSQLKINSDSADIDKMLEKSKLKTKPPPLDIKAVRSCENFTSSYSPLLSASAFDSGSNPSSAVSLTSFDFSNSHIIQFTLDQDKNSVEKCLNNSDDSSVVEVNKSETEKMEKDKVYKIPESFSVDTVSVLSNSNIISSVKRISPRSVFTDNNIVKLDSKGINPSAISNVEFWNENSDKLDESSKTSHTSACSSPGVDAANSDSGREQCVSCSTDFVSTKVETYLTQQNSMVEEDTKNSVVRSTSDVCDSTTSDALKKRRERKERPYKSDPFTGSPHLPSAKPRCPATKEEFFEIDEISLEEVEEEESSLISEQDWEKETKKQHRLSDISTDSGVTGHEYPPSPTSTLFSTSSSIFCHEEVLTDSVHKDRGSGIRCEPKSPRIPYSKVSSGCKECGCYDNNNGTNICAKCEKRSIERKEIILEIKETEESYGRDLAILKEHFYKPIKSAGLLSMEHLEGIFLNLDELVHVNTQFVKKLQSAVDMATKKGDENLRTVSIGNLFLDSSSLILAFENYCVNQGQAVVLLEQLEKEKELLRIFLQVSQDENPLLRRMPLKSFLMVPVQRIMRYPLLLERLYKFTSGDHTDKSALMEAKLKIEDILDHINSKTKHGGTVKLKRKISESIYQRISITEKIEVNKVAIEVLGWNRKEVCDVVMCRLQVAALSDQTWAARRLKSLKFTTVHCVLLTLGQSDTDLSEVEDDNLLFAKKTRVIQAAVVLIKEKNGKYQTFREPFMLNRCVVSVDPDMESAFELSDLSQEPCLFKGDDLKELKSFLQNVKQQTLNLATWRKRRNALPNIMIKHMV